jgi:hypothetical protein
VSTTALHELLENAVQFVSAKKRKTLRPTRT